MIIQHLETREFPDDGRVEVGVILTDHFEGRLRETRGIIATEPGFANSRVSGVLTKNLRSLVQFVIIKNFTNIHI